MKLLMTMTDIIAARGDNACIDLKGNARRREMINQLFAAAETSKSSKRK